MISSLLFLITSVSGQVIISNDRSSVADSSAVLEVKSNNKGFLPPRMTLVERTLIPNPAEGLIVFCYDCGPENTPVVSVFINGSWRNLIDCNPPNHPVSANQIPCPDQIIWRWYTVPGATGYGWSKTQDSVENYLATDTSFLETGLGIDITYNRYVWAYNNCGSSISAVLTGTTSLDSLRLPVPAEHDVSGDKIIWKWNEVAGAIGYKWNTIDDYLTATDVGADTSKTETGLDCLTAYTRYIWAYNYCGNSGSIVLNASTIDIPINGAPVEGAHVQDITSINWKWYSMPEATGYKWNMINDFDSAIDMGIDTSYFEDSLTCGTVYNRYAWAYNDCGISSPVVLSGATPDEAPACPDAEPYEALLDRITWHWSQVAGAVGYKWYSMLDFENAVDLEEDTLYFQTGLQCNTEYSSYIWSYNQCGHSSPLTLNGITLDDGPAAPDAAPNDPSSDRITWRWSHVAGATGYKWNDQNDLQSAIDLGYSNFYPETGLNCWSEYSRYVWAYGECGTSFSTLLSDSTLYVPIEQPPLEAAHESTLTSIQWNWHPVCDTCRYKWGISDDFYSAIDLGTDTFNIEAGLACGTEYSRYVWVYNNCGYSQSSLLTMSTTTTPPESPQAGTHVPDSLQITWNWTQAENATGYLWNTLNDSLSATDLGMQTSYLEEGLTCRTPYSRYVWAYHDCAVSGAVQLNDTTLEIPISETVEEATHIPGHDTVLWKWHKMNGATGYKWNTINDYSTAIDLNNDTSYVETGLDCLTLYTRYIWAYDLCGNSAFTAISTTSAEWDPDSPAEAVHEHTSAQINWKWHPVDGATGYKWSATNDYVNALDVGNDTSHLETGLTCGTPYTRYVWTYNLCGHSQVATTLTQSTSNCWVCGNQITVVHVADYVAPVGKTVTYGTVTNVPGEASKCWITSNLGADHQASNYNDNTEASAGWYWQFNHPQGFMHTGSARTPNSAWIAEINEYSDWTTTNDPCAIEVGTGWRVPTATEWENVDAGGVWTNWIHPWNSLLKMHAAGRLDFTTGNLQERGFKGSYWSSVQYGIVTWGQSFNFSGSNCGTSQYQKAYAFTIRCVRN